MKVLYFDCFSGISGDMTLGALLDLGVNPELFISELNKLGLDEYDIKIEKKVKSSIAGTDVNVILHSDDSYNAEHEEHNDSCSLHHHEPSRHTHEHSGDHAHIHAQDDHSHTARNLKDIEDLIESSHLKQEVKELSKRIFREIALAEAHVHNKDIFEVHFHEVGAVDSIVDIVGTAICMDLLGADRIYCSPLHEGSGFIQCRHGMMPVPVPAVMEMLKESNIPLITEDVNTEMVTPTGIAIVKTTAASFGQMPDMSVNKVGYGMGKRETGRFNALRVVMGTLADRSETPEEIVMLETSIDDMSPEILGFVMEKLMEQGALDVFYTPIHMKKNRPGVMMTALCSRQDEQKIVDTIMKETSTLGIRRSITQRYCLKREIVTVATEYGDVHMKIAGTGEAKKVSPEYEDCRAIAQETGIPLRDVYSKAYEAYRSYTK